MISLIPFVIILITECLKVIVQSFKQKRFTPAWFFHSGGMPSGHSAFTSSLTTLVGYTEGIESTSFLLAFSFMIIVIYDARGVRASVGKHAEILNHMNKEKKFEESIGHTNWEVIVGLCTGSSITSLLLWMMQ
ncbi:hypothetical protein COB57_04370 [Candidatus Peregrinibacteria bacterium]|nr:MAG: hypothetical protein COB57_04370 [Candidatus Peregrinibacteria bacterium]